MADGRTAKSLKNIIWGYAETIIGLILNLISRTIFVQLIGVEFLGINGLFGNILTVLSLADMGFSTAMAYSYYKPISDHDTEKIAALNYFYKRIYLFIALIIALLGVVLLPFLTQIVNLDDPIEYLHIYYLLILAGTVSSYLVVYKGTLINANQQHYIISKCNSIVRASITITQIVFMILTKNYIVYLLIVLIGNIINNIVVSVVANKLFPYIKEKHYLSKKEQCAIIKNIKSIFIYKLSSVLLNGTDNILISSYVGTIWVGYYSNYLVVVNNITTFINIAFRSLIAGIGDLIVKESPQKCYNLFTTTQIVSFWFSTVIISCLYVLIDEFVLCWLGSSYLLDQLTVFAIALNLYLTCILQPLWIYRDATGIYTKTKFVMLITACLNLALSIWGGIYFGLAGIILASAAAKIMTYVWYEPILLFKMYFEQSANKYFISILLNSALTVVLTIILKCFIVLIPLQSWSGFIIKGFTCFAVSNLLFFTVYCRNQYLKEILLKLKKMIKC